MGWTDLAQDRERWRVLVNTVMYLLKKLNSVALVSKRTIPTERPTLVGQVSANFCG
jgi:hypothetical protein